MEFSPSLLTYRQQEIGLCLVTGLSLKAIAKHLNLSVTTVKEHQTLIRKKLLCQNAYQMGYRLALFFKQRTDFSLTTLYLEGDHPAFGG